ncbi:hypothetical protein B0T20DRAFT_487585 [Sordaria brevicollis]|uniref:DUF1275 domain protein n=1 Tax=Sordaria brevicollis TaxID=83679 RepID=A0AAE0P9S3_SORBR|nr:hypothetical protein B0T20DRAFT_487585 [Sordaria brevicollis]
MTTSTPPPPAVSPPQPEQVDSSNSSTLTVTPFRCPKYACHQPSQRSSSGPSWTSRTWAYLNEDVVPSTFAEIQLVLLTFCIGLQDAVSFPDFHCFASNQTGNTVFLLLAAALPEFNPSMFITANIACSLGFFLFSAWLTGQLGHLIGPRRRLWLLTTNLIQTSLVFIAAGLQFGAHHTNTPGKELYESGKIESMEAVTGARTLICIALLASAAGSQVVLSRSLNMTEITTAMATAAWLDLVIDKNMFRSPKKNRGRNRRVAFLVALALGSLVGAYIYRWVGSAVAVVVSGGGKAVVGGMFLFSRGEKRRRVGGDVEGGGGGQGGKGEGKEEEKDGDGKAESKESGSGSDSEADEKLGQATRGRRADENV